MRAPLHHRIVAVLNRVRDALASIASSTRCPGAYTVAIKEQTAEGELLFFSGHFEYEAAAQEYQHDLACIYKPSLDGATCSFTVVPLDHVM